MTNCLKKTYIIHLLITVFALTLFSCSNTRNIVYMDQITDSNIKSPYKSTESKIQTGDLLSINVSSLNPQASAIFNAPNESTTNTNMASQYGLTVGYLVNDSGYIQFPFLGAIKTEGLTKSQLNKELVKQLTEKKLLIDPIITIRQLNFRVSVLGEVARPGAFTVPNEKISILEALGMAGDLTMYGNRSNVLLVREDGRGEKETRRIDLRSKNLLSSQYYWLRSNDVIYVEPTKDKVQREKNLVLFPIVISLTTLFIIVLDRVNF
jgi:polysaccharide export outer membrane protein